MLQAKLFQEEENTGGGIKIPVGIHTGTVSFSGLSTDSTWSDLNFTSDEGRVIHKRLFVPTGSSPKEGETIQQALDREIRRNLGFVVQAMRAVLDEAVVDSFEAPDYKSFIQAAGVLLNEKKGTKVNLKVVPDYKEDKYPDIPAYGTYVERFVEGTDTKLYFSKKESEAIERMNSNRATANSNGKLAEEDAEGLV